MSQGLNVKITVIFCFLFLAGCRLKSEVIVNLGTKIKDVFSFQNSYELTEYRFSIEPKTESILSITTLDSNLLARTINLGIKSEDVMTLTYEDNFWVFSTTVYNEIAGGNEVVTYYVNLNDALPQAIKFSDQVALPCAFSNYERWFKVIAGYLYCAASSNRELLKINLSDYSDIVNFNSIIVSNDWHSNSTRVGDTTHFFDNDILYLKIGTTSGAKIIRIQNNAITANWQVSASGYYVYGVHKIDDKVVTVNSDATYTVYTDSAINVFNIPNLVAYNVNPVTTNHILADKDIYNLACNEEGILQSEEGLYKTNISNLDVPVTEYFSLENLKCEIYKVKMFHLNGTLFLRAEDKTDNKVYLYKFNPTAAIKFEKIIELADHAANFLGNNEKNADNSFYFDSSRVCFSAKSGSVYRPYCLNESHSLIQLGTISSSSAMNAPVKFKKQGSNLLFLAKVNNQVLLYKTDLTNYVTSELHEINDIVNLDYAWEPVYASSEFETILNTTNSDLLVMHFSDLIYEARVEDQKGNEYKYASSKVNSGGIYNLHAYKDKILVLYSYNNYNEFVIYDKTSARKVALEHKVVYGYSGVIAFDYRYVYFVDVANRFLRLDLEKESTVVLDENILTFSLIQGRIFYSQKNSFKIFEINEKLEKNEIYTSISEDIELLENLPDKFFVAGDYLYLKTFMESEGIEALVQLNKNGNRIVRDDQGQLVDFDNFWITAGPDERYSLAAGNDSLHVINNSSGIVEATYPFGNDDIYLQNIIVREQFIQKIIIQENTAANPKNIKLLEVNSSLEEVIYILPEVIEDTDVLSESQLMLTENRVLLALSRDGVDQVYLLRKSPELPVLIFENKHDVIIATVNDPLLTNNLESTFEIFFDEDQNKVGVVYSKLIDGHLGGAYAEYSLDTDTFVDRKIVSDTNRHLWTGTIYYKWGNLHSPSYLDNGWEEEEKIVLSRHKRYSFFRYYENSKWFYKVTEFMEYDKTLLNIEREKVVN